MPKELHHFPSLPDIGLPEAYYAQLARRADQMGDHFAKEAAKVGQYITLALDQNLDWASKRRYFEHALHRHCVPPALPNEQVWLFYQRMADLIRKHAGLEAMRLASKEDDHYAHLSKTGVPRHVIASKAQVFFSHLTGLDARRPDWFTEEDWKQLKILRLLWTGK
jgi:hypothetical protein